MQLRTWAEEEFGLAALGNKRRTARLVAITEELAKDPEPSVLKVLKKQAARDAAYVFLRSNEFSTEAIEDARTLSCLKKMEALSGDLIIPIDQTSFTLPDHTGRRDFGSVGNRSRKMRGVQCMTAMPLDSEGTPLGILRQLYWARSETPGPARVRPNKKEPDRRPRAVKESSYWIEIVQTVCEKAQLLPSQVRPWLQCDRGADIWGTFLAAYKHDVLLTVRVYTNRQVILDDGERGQLLPWMEALPVAGTYTVDVPARPKRPARMAQLRVSFGRARVRLGPTPSKREEVPLYYVHAHEEGAPKGAKPLCWKLATTFPVHTLDDALRVVANYKLRWRVEEFHRTLKEGIFNLEKSQLGSFRAFHRWAILHSSVAARVERIKLLARTQPDAPATVEFTRDEIDTAIMLRHEAMVRKKPPYQRGDTPTISELTFWIADIGGYAGSRTKPKPGSVPISRGLEYLAIAVRTLQLAGFFALEKSH